MFVFKMIGIAWAFQLCYPFTICSIPDLVMTIYELKKRRISKIAETQLFENFQNMSSKTPPKDNE